MSTVEIEIGGRLFSGWKSVRIDTDIESLSSSFSVGARDKDGLLSSIVAGTECKVYIVDKTKKLVLDGHVVQRERSLTSSAHDVSISGNDKLADLVDCSAIKSNRVWIKKKFTAIIKAIASEFSIDVNTTAVASDPIIDKYVLQTGESAFDTIERLCRTQGVLPISSFDGKLILSYAATAAERCVENLVVGQNILDIKETSDWNERFSQYICISQNAGNGKKWDAAILQCKAVSSDASVTRYRPKLFTAENRSDNAMLVKRANWEAQVRAGRSTTYSLSVRGWFQKIAGIPSSTLWEKNKRVNLKVDAWDIDEELLVTSVSYSLDNNGEITALTLRHPDTYLKDPTASISI